MTNMMSFPCPHCKVGLKAPGDAAGREARCDHCQKPFIIPAQFLFDEPAPAPVKKPSPSSTVVGEKVGRKIGEKTVGGNPGATPGRSGLGPVFVKPEPKSPAQPEKAGQKQALNQVSHVASLLALPLIAVVVLGGIAWWFFSGDADEPKTSNEGIVDAATATDPTAEAAAAAEVKRLRAERDRLQVSTPAVIPVVPATAVAVPSASTSAAGTPSAAAPSAVAETPKGKPSITDLVEQFGPSVVVVKTNVGSGAGFVAFAPDYIVTNYHVVSGTQSVQAVFIEGKNASPRSVTVVAVDVDNDLALLRLSEPSKVSVLEFASDTDVQIGAEVFAIGSPGVGTTVLTQAVIPGTVSNVELVIGKQKFIQTNTAISPIHSGVPLFDLAGKVIGVVSAKENRQENMGFSLPSSFVKVLYREREKKFRVDGEFIAWEAKQPFERLKRHAGAIPLNTYPIDLLFDAERDQLIGVSPETNKVIFIDLKSRKVVREVFPAGTDPVDLKFGAPGEVWVANRTSKNLVALDLVSGKITKNISLAHEPQAFVIGRKSMWFMDGAGQALVIKNTGKDESETALNIRSLSTYGAGVNILCGSTTAWLCEFESDKFEAAITHRRVLKTALNDLNASVKAGTSQTIEAKRKSLAKELASNEVVLSKAIKTYSKPAGVEGDFSAKQQSLFVDEPRKRIYFNRCVMELKDPGKIIGVFKSPEHSLKNSETLRAFWSKNPSLDQIRAVSPDGTVAVSGTHIYNATDFTVIAELPVPTTAVVFHTDNKTLYFSDPVNNQVVGIEYRSKANE